jgi:hypothetical protein
MAKQPSDVTSHHDVSKSGPASGKDINPHSHPLESVPLRIAKESGFAAPGLDAPTQRQRPARASGTPQDHPVNRPINDEDKSLIGPQLGRGGTEGPRLAPVQATKTYVDPEFTGRPGETFEKTADIAAANANFQDCSDLLMRPRGAPNGD